MLWETTFKKVPDYPQPALWLTRQQACPGISTFGFLKPETPGRLQPSTMTIVEIYGHSPVSTFDNYRSYIESSILVR
jgi:hypothetical protein